MKSCWWHWSCSVHNIINDGIFLPKVIMSPCGSLTRLDMTVTSLPTHYNSNGSLVYRYNYVVSQSTEYEATNERNKETDEKSKWIIMIITTTTTITITISKWNEY